MVSEYVLCGTGSDEGGLGQVCILRKRREGKRWCCDDGEALPMVVWFAFGVFFHPSYQSKAKQQLQS